MIISEQDAIQKMKDQCQTGDEETDHMRADRILCDILETLGYSELVEVYNDIDKYYA